MSSKYMSAKTWESRNLKRDTTKGTKHWENNQEGLHRIPKTFFLLKEHANQKREVKIHSTLERSHNVGLGIPSRQTPTFYIYIQYLASNSCCTVGPLPFSFPFLFPFPHCIKQKQRKTGFKWGYFYHAKLYQLSQSFCDQLISPLEYI